MRTVSIPRLALVLSAASGMAFGTPAAACDLDGLPGMGGFHRYNPFASHAAAPVPRRSIGSAIAQPSSASSDRGESKDASERRRKANRPTPPRAWESDDGNGSISAGDKATFT